ncbi:MAG TPA: flagellar hook-basal body complex protein, partial [Vicinamibacterales bacterium]
TGLPSANDNAATPSAAPKSIEVIDNLGNRRQLDVYVTRTTTAGGSSSTWEITVFDSAARNTGGGDFFPYTGGAAAVLATGTFDFNATGALTTAPANLSIPIPNGQSMTLDLSQLSSLNSAYTPEITKNGTAPSAVTEYQISEDGTLFAIYESGDRVPTYKIPLASVPSPDKMSVQPGNVFLTTQESGDFSLGYPSEGGRGTIEGFTLEQSNVDLANELTNMIEAQRNYTANSKVFQTSAELMDVLVNLSR